MSGSDAKALADLEAAPEDETRPLLPKKTVGRLVEEWRRWNRFFLEPHNRQFDVDAELALRAAVFVLILGGPYIFPDQVQTTWILRLKRTGLANKSMVLYFIYTIYKTVGETVHYAWCGISGTVLAALWVWSMLLIVPMGLDGHETVLIWVFGWLSGAIFVLLMLWLNLNISTKIFAISSFVWYWAEFLNPAPDDFLKGFHLANLTTNTEWGPAMRDLFGASWGCLLAVLVTLLPYPLWALRKATHSAEELITVSSDGWNEFLEYFCKDRSCEYLQDKVKRSLREQQKDLASLEFQIDNAWWECWSPSSVAAREMMAKYCKMMHICSDRLAAYWSLCGRKGDFEQEHAEIVRRIRPQAKLALTEALNLMAKCMQAATQAARTCSPLRPGGATPEMTAELSAASLRVSGASRDFEEAFRTAKRELQLPGISEELLDEHVFCLSLCCLCRLATECAEDLAQPVRGSAGLHDRLPVMVDLMQNLFRGIFAKDQLVDPLHVNTVFRNACAIFLGFIVGFIGMGNVLPAKSAHIASTSAVLLSTFTGSAMAKNLGRVQGVVIGTGVGEMVTAFVSGQCGFFGHSISIACLFVWTFMTLFMYYNAESPQYSYLGCLLAAFGASKMINDCDAPVNLAGDHRSNLEVITAVSIIACIDLLSGARRPSVMAYEASSRAWSGIKDALARLFDPDKPNVRFHKGDVLGSIQKASDLGSEAAQEPRYWRRKWHEEEYTKAIHALFHLRFLLTSVEHSVAVGFGYQACMNGSSKSDAFIAVLRRPGFRRIPELVLTKMALLVRLMCLFRHEGMGLPEEYNDPEIETEHLAACQVAIREFVADVNKSGDLVTPRGGELSAATSVEEDPACVLSLVLLALEAMVYELRYLQHALLERAPP
mmetsp:Transcript_130546/g.279041  ORF Transcript_130546/g.279041 Transcript_130546/m.279041 type:complete len:885 (-) Transcript_130546:72-2726(-)